MGNAPSKQTERRPWTSMFFGAFHTLRGLAGQTLLLPAVAAVALGLVFLAWSCEREARQRQALETEGLRQRAEQEIAGLEARVAANLREARAQNEAAMRELATRRAQLDREAANLRERLSALRRQEAAQVAEVAALPASQVVDRVVGRLGRAGARNWGLGIRDEAGARESGPGTRDTKIANRYSGLGTQEHKPIPDSTFQIPDSTFQIPNESEAPTVPAGGQGPAPRPGSSAPSPQPLAPSPESRLTNPESPVLGLTEAGARRVETAFVELDSCRAASVLKDQELANCQERGRVQESAITQQDITLQKLNAALADKDRIQARREEAHRAELKLARGTRRGRFFSALKYVAAGLVAGVLLR